MKDNGNTLNSRIAAQVRNLRTVKGLSLDALAVKSRVSRSMISLIERAEASPTAVILEKLAAALGVTLASLFEDPMPSGKATAPIARRNEQVQWTDPDSGYVRRNVSPPGVPQPIQLVEVLFPPRVRVAFESGSRTPRVNQQIWMLQGTMDVTVGRERHRLAAGDCLAMQLDSPTMFYNPTPKTARYAVITSSEPALKR